MRAWNEEREMANAEKAATARPEQWSVTLMGRTDQMIFVEVRNGLGGVWSGRLQRVE